MRPIPRRFRGGVGSSARLAVAGALLGALLLFQLGPAGAAETANGPQDEVRAALEKWRIAFNNRDEQQVCNLFARNLIANYESQPEQDYASLCDLLHTAIEDRERRYHYSLSINEILVYGDSAVARLVWTLEIAKTGSPKEVVEEPAVDIFRHQTDGSWKISRYFAYSSPR